MCNKIPVFRNRSKSRLEAIQFDVFQLTLQVESSSEAILFHKCLNSINRKDSVDTDINFMVPCDAHIPLPRQKGTLLTR